MKKISILLTVLLFCSQIVFADENAIVVPEQNTENEQAYFTANIQKQPLEKGSKQAIKNHFTFFTININANGKVINYISPEEKQ